MPTYRCPSSSFSTSSTCLRCSVEFAKLPSRNLLATGTSARHITLIDPRASATQISFLTLRGHKNAIVSLATDPSSEYNLASGSHDGTVQIWDLRNVSAGGQIGEGMTGERLHDQQARAGGCEEPWRRCEGLRGVLG
jgi:centromere/kinetochore protein ZW10